MFNSQFPIMYYRRAKQKINRPCYSLQLNICIAVQVVSSSANYSTVQFIEQVEVKNMVMLAVRYLCRMNFV
jgi:hypothetical protein